jgi:hypothetical protein
MMLETSNMTKLNLKSFSRHPVCYPRIMGTLSPGTESPNLEAAHAALRRSSRGYTVPYVFMA